MNLSALQNPAPALQRARGNGTITAFDSNGRTRLAVLHEEGCAKIRVPHTHDRSLQAVLINTAGGLTGGDNVRWEATAGADTALVLTTQACERVYRSLGPDAHVSIRLTAEADARLDWLPQETILFERGKLRRTLDVDLTEGATFCAVEAVILGRHAMGEDARGATLRDDWRIRRNGRLIHAEATRLGGGDLERDRLSLLDSAGAFATVLYIGADADRRLDPARAVLSGRSGASLVGERLIVRAIAPSGLALRKILGPVVAMLAGSLPRLWHI